MNILQPRKQLIAALVRRTTTTTTSSTVLQQNANSATRNVVRRDHLALGECHGQGQEV